MKKLAVTGNRPQGLNKVMKYGDFNDSLFMDYIEMIYAIADDYIRKGYDYFISGGALGVDLDFAEAIIHIRKNENLVKLEMAIPCDNQDLKWNADDKLRYREVLFEANFITHVGTKYTYDCMQKRNKYMVDQADKVLAFWNGIPHGGTWNTIQYCKEIGKEIEIIPIFNLSYLC